MLIDHLAKVVCNRSRIGWTRVAADGVVEDIGHVYERYVSYTLKTRVDAPMGGCGPAYAAPGRSLRWGLAGDVGGCGSHDGLWNFSVAVKGVDHPFPVRRKTTVVLS